MVFTRSTTSKSSSTQAQPVKPDTKKRANKDVLVDVKKKRAIEGKFRNGAPLNQIIEEEITLTNQNAQSVKFSELLKTNVVIFLYPRANTPGCTKQACGFRDQYSALQKAGFDVFGLSRDSSNVLKSWKQKQNLPYDLLSDPKSQLIKYFGSSTGSKIQRSHVIILKGGIIGDFQSKVTPAQSVERALSYATKAKHDPDDDDKHSTNSPPSPDPSGSSAAIGSTATAEILLNNQNDESVLFQDIIRDYNVIFFMFPQANTPGCTTQAKAFNTIIDAIQKDGYRVYGVSADSPKSLKVWKDQHSFAFDLLSDPKHSLIGYFGSSVNKTSINRSHAIVLQGGEIADIQHNMKPEESAEKAFAYVKAHPVT